MGSAPANDRFLHGGAAIYTRLVLPAVNLQLVLEHAHLTLSIDIRLDGRSPTSTDSASVATIA